MSNGKKCGKRSAYSKPGGYQPLCYKSDITRKKETLIQKRKLRLLMETLYILTKKNIDCMALMHLKSINNVKLTKNLTPVVFNLKNFWSL